MTELNTVLQSPGVTELLVSDTNPSEGNDPNFRRAVRVAVTTDGSNSNPNFSDEAAVYIVETAGHGQNVFGGGTNAKKTIAPCLLELNSAAAGQRIVFNRTLHAYGMGDSGLESGVNTFSGGPIRGDEGQTFALVTYLQQATTKALTAISSVPSQASLSTTITQNITASKDAQTVTVATTAGCNVGDWLVIGQELPSGTPNLEAIQVISIPSTGNINAVFVNNHASGVTVTPALVLNVSDVTGFGQDRVLVNLTGASYSAGTVSSISGGGFTGSGTSWANNVVGGNATNIGAIALTSDDYSGPPFNGSGTTGTLKSWYQINGVTSSTVLGVHSFSVASDSAYHGNGVGTGAYIIRPCAKILRIISNSVICETSSATWSPGDSVECVICPYPDVTGMQYQMAVWTPGGIRRAFMAATNAGARTIGTGFQVQSALAAGGDAIGWDTGFQTIGSVNTGLSITDARREAIALSSAGTGGSHDEGGKINWNGPYIMPNSPNEGMDMQLIMSGFGGKLAAISSTVVGTGSRSTLTWDGIMGTTPTTFSALPTAASGLNGLVAYITDCNTTTAGASAAGGGSNHVFVGCKNAAWKVIL